jgi:hypothetical protein
VRTSITTTIAAILAAATISSSAFANNKPYVPYSYQGFGTASCSVFNKHARDAMWLNEFHAWTQGMISGLNYDGVKEDGSYRDLHSLTVDEQKNVLITYCRQHPDEQFMGAIGALYSALDTVSENKTMGGESNNKWSKN